MLAAKSPNNIAGFKNVIGCQIQMNNYGYYLSFEKNNCSLHLPIKKNTLLYYIQYSKNSVSQNEYRYKYIIDLRLNLCSNYSLSFIRFSKMIQGTSCLEPLELSIAKRVVKFAFIG